MFNQMLFVSACALAFDATYHQNQSNRNTNRLLFANAYTSESMPQRPIKNATPTRPTRLGHHNERPLAPPFPNGSCGGTIITLPRRELFPGQGSESMGIGDIPFLNNLNLDTLNPLSSLENAVLPPRDVKVWLPREYHAPEYRTHDFPILYCHDGQNAIDDASSWTGSSWRLVGALTRLSERKMLSTNTPPIVVCIPCADGGFLPGMPRRHSEYGDYTHPISQAHGDFVATKLHPYVTSRFRVMQGPEHTSTIGSSLGGQASMQLLLRYPDIFGGAACLSPCFTPGTIAAVMANLAIDGYAGNNDKNYKPLSREIEKERHKMSLGQTRTLHSKTIYIDNGGDVEDTRVPVFEAMDHFTLNERWWNPGYWWLDTSLQPMIDAMRWTLDQGGVRYVYEKFPGGRHNERAWAQRIHRPLLALIWEKVKEFGWVIILKSTGHSAGNFYSRNKHQIPLGL
eukprot:CAMPEP_0183761752 /NCGR_PEP_ID=MMETSP0739-20130205/8632_1 /TAXON_ID=385413 /ORGANISM="Thalassiosira miniscula, Strain CCMP1093" /LENGTH=454 /DNA_ID=CAMNT_0025999949 /DNA_START=42 /DNA_END=1406 /DNA_ORIENTATION=+